MIFLQEFPNITSEWDIKCVTNTAGQNVWDISKPPNSLTCAQRKYTFMIYPSFNGKLSYIGLQCVKTIHKTLQITWPECGTDFQDKLNWQRSFEKFLSQFVSNNISVHRWNILVMLAIYIQIWNGKRKSPVQQLMNGELKFYLAWSVSWNQSFSLKYYRIFVELQIVWNRFLIPEKMWRCRQTIKNLLELFLSTSATMLNIISYPQRLSWKERYNF